MICTRHTSPATLLCLLAALLGCGSGSRIATTPTTTPPATPADFTLAATPATVALTVGTPAPVSVTATATGAFTAPVAVALTGLPTGITATPSSLTLTPGTPQTLTLSATGALPSGNTLTLTGTSGSLAHTATITIAAVAAPAPPPDFTFTLSPASQSLTAGGTAAAVTLLSSPVNGFTGNVTVAFSGAPAGVAATPATLTLAPGIPQTVSFTASATAAPATTTISATATSGTLTHSASLALTVQAAAPAIADVTTYHNHNSRDGLYATETTLTLANVNPASFGLLATYPVDGKVDAQPLFVANLQRPGASTPANLLLVATEHDSVYAIDTATGVPAWHTSILPAGEAPSDSRGCDQIEPEIGITSTPVIDRTHGPNGAIVVVGMSRDPAGAYHQRLHALDLATGAELPGSPTEITATYPGNGANSVNGQVVFDPAQYAERAGLLLLNGAIYTAWTSHCDHQPYTGWVMAFSEATLAQTSVLNLTPNGSEGSVWMSGFGLAADTAGNIYFLDANGTLDPTFTPAGFPSQSDFGNAILKLSTTNGNLAVTDFFEPFNTVDESNRDLDLGSGGALLLPDLTDAAGATRHLLLGAGKDGNLYLADRDHLGKFNQASADNSNLYQELPNALPNGAWSGPAAFNNTVFLGSPNDVLRAFTLTSARLNPGPASQSSSQTATRFPYPGPTPAVSANGAADGIVWAVESGIGIPAVLHAFDPANLAHELYNSTQAPNSRDSFGTGNKFITPVIANGRVYIGTPTGVAVFGLLHP